MRKPLAVRYAASARKDLLKLNGPAAKLIVRGIERKAGNPNPLHDAKRLGGVFGGLYRYRIGDYRAIFQIDETGSLIILTILRIRHRKDAYR